MMGLDGREALLLLAAVLVGTMAEVHLPPLVWSLWLRLRGRAERGGAAGGRS